SPPVDMAVHLFAAGGEVFGAIEANLRGSASLQAEGRSRIAVERPAIDPLKNRGKPVKRKRHEIALGAPSVRPGTVGVPVDKLIFLGNAERAQRTVRQAAQHLMRQVIPDAAVGQIAKRF